MKLSDFNIGDLFIRRIYGCIDLCLFVGRYNYADGSGGHDLSFVRLSDLQVLYPALYMFDDDACDPGYTRA